MYIISSVLLYDAKITMKSVTYYPNLWVIPKDGLHEMICQVNIIFKSRLIYKSLTRNVNSKKFGQL